MTVLAEHSCQQFSIDSESLFTIGLVEEEDPRS